MKKYISIFIILFVFIVDMAFADGSFTSASGVMHGISKSNIKKTIEVCYFIFLFFNMLFLFAKLFDFFVRRREGKATFIKDFPFFYLIITIALIAILIMPSWIIN